MRLGATRRKSFPLPFLRRRLVRSPVARNSVCLLQSLRPARRFWRSSRTGQIAGCQSVPPRAKSDSPDARRQREDRRDDFSTDTNCKKGADRKAGPTWPSGPQSHRAPEDGRFMRARRPIFRLSRFSCDLRAAKPPQRRQPYRASVVVLGGVLRSGRSRRSRRSIVVVNSPR